MTISSTTRKAGPYVGNSSATSFAFAFKVFVTSDVVVTLTDIPTGAESILTLTTHYTVSLNADQNANPGGSVTYNPSGTPIPSTKKLTLTSGVPNLQGTDIVNSGGIYLQVIEDALDKRTIIEQQEAEKSLRALRFPVSDSPLVGTLPAAAQRANKALIFDASGNVDVSEDDFNDQAASAAASAAVAVAAAVAADASADDAAASADDAAASAASVASAAWNRLEIADSANKTLLAADAGALWLPNSTSAQIFNLPTAASVGAGHCISFMTAPGGTNTVTINTNGGDLIQLPTYDGTNKFVLTAGFYQRSDTVTFMSTAGTGVEWVIISASPHYAQMPGLKDGSVRWLATFVTHFTLSPRDGNGLYLYDTSAKQWRMYAVSNAALDIDSENCTIDGTPGGNLGGVGNIDKDFFAYAYIDNNALAVDFSETPPGQEAITGFFVKGSGGGQDASRRLIGGGRYMTTIKLGMDERNYNSGSYFNRLTVNVAAKGIGGTTTDTNWHRITSDTTRVTAWGWGDGTEPLVTLTGTFGNSVPGAESFIGIGVDDATPARWVEFIASAGNPHTPFAVVEPMNALAGGLHTYDVWMKTSSGGTAVIVNEVELVVKVND